MSSSHQEQTSRNPSGQIRPEELPPVQPPSAGFIVQLFLIPALIVMAVIAVWALFGKLADSGSDWTQLVVELGSGNEHRQWRAAQELAQMLRNDQISPPSDRPPLSEIPEVANSLVDLLKKSLATGNPSEEELLQQKFLARALGGLSSDDTVLPVLAAALDPARDISVRESAMMSVNSITGRHFDRLTSYDPAQESQSEAKIPDRRPLPEPALAHPEILAQIRIAAQEQQPLLRSLAAYALGNISGPESIELLQVMLLDGDAATRANVVMSLARNGVAAAVPELLNILNDSQQPFSADGQKFADETARRRAEVEYEAQRPVLARNGLRAALDLWQRAAAAQQDELLQTVLSVADCSSLPADVRLQAQELHTLLSKQR
jgi:hypothetical protein